MCLTLGEYLDIVNIAKIDDLVELETNRKLIINAIRTSNIFGGKVKDNPIFTEKDIVYYGENNKEENNYISNGDKKKLEEDLIAMFL